MSKVVKCVLINVNVVLIAEVIEIDAQLGDPNCKLISPFLFTKINDSKDFYLEPWPEVTYQKEIMLRSEDILTIADPTPEIVEKYLELTA
jgi:hypothetical protein